LGPKNYNDAPTRVSKKCDDMSIRLDTVPALDKTDGQTDGFAKTISRSACIAY